ncbi:MAG: DUF2279 domain-containing protein [Ignavibacteriaceae bacterium]
MINKIIFLINVIVVINFNCIYAQQKDSSSSDINYYKLGALGAVTVGAFVYSYALQNDLWWKGEKSKFHFEWDYDWKYALGSDKFGHFYFPNLFTTIYSDALQWTGIDENKSLIYAASVALLHQTYTEIQDGFSKKWGFSWGDFTANTLGASYPLLQKRFAVLQNFDFKISYFPSERFKNHSHKVIIDDYESTYNWLSINVYNFLPGNIKKYYPAFVNLALGYSVKKLDFPDEAYREVFIGLDWNFEALPGESEFLKKLKKYLNFYHFPAPAVRISPGVIWYGLKF